ncbi:hypothetical protein HPB47_008805 [Ixodes persulcatus]|uniref:Uncharacterized protein n=1 Tax=Ixodes persulcatus TaxID=34615 RepID=A0AC60P3Y3_IXOPE|nr:hypothetical protein HPB47_008805 [Ixodes persulcatus]
MRGAGGSLRGKQPARLVCPSFLPGRCARAVRGNQCLASSNGLAKPQLPSPGIPALFCTSTCLAALQAGKMALNTLAQARPPTRHSPPMCCCMAAYLR